MPTKTSSNVKFEIGHVMFIDIVGCSKLLISDQSQRLQRLKENVWGTEQFRLARAENKLLRLPTQDEVLGDHRGQSQQSRLELGLHLSRRFSAVPGIIGYPA